MYGDTSYNWLASGSTSASADDTGIALYGTYGGLSLLNQDDVVLLEARAVTNSLRIFPTNSASATSFGRLHEAGSPYETYRAMRVGDASQLVFANHTATADAVLYWELWRRQ